MSACIDCTDAVEHQSDGLSLCNKEISRAKNSCTRIGHRLEVKVCKIRLKSRLTVNRIFLFEPHFLDTSLATVLTFHHFDRVKIYDPIGLVG